MNYNERLLKYNPVNEQEIKDKEVMLEAIRLYGDKTLYRECELAHFSASAWVINSSGTKALLNYHNIYKNWGWLGGHADGEADLLKLCLKEVEEESGLKHFKAYTDDVISVEILPVPYHIKRGRFVNSHLHMNLTYLIVADEADELVIKPDENSGLKWVLLDDVKNIVKEEAMLPIYAKLNEYVKKHFKE